MDASSYASYDDDRPSNNLDDSGSVVEVNVSSQSLDDLPPVVVSVYPTTLVASFNRISYLEVGAFGDYLSGLIRLDLSHNRLSGSPPPLGAAAPRLEVLNVSFNDLASLSLVGGCHALRELWANDNSIAMSLAATLLPVCTLPWLETLALHNNPCINVAPTGDDGRDPTGASDARVLYIVHACSASLRNLSVSTPRILAREAFASGTLADGGSGSCAAVASIPSVLTVTPALSRAARAWHDGLVASTPPLRHLVSSHSLVRSGSTRLLAGLPQQLPRTPSDVSRLRTAKSSSRLGTARASGRFQDAAADGTLHAQGQEGLGADADPLTGRSGPMTFRYPFFGPPPGYEHVLPYNLIAADDSKAAQLSGPPPPPAPLSAATVARLSRKSSRGDLESSGASPGTARLTTPAMSARRLPGLSSPPASGGRASRAEAALASPVSSRRALDASLGGGGGGRLALPPLGLAASSDAALATRGGQQQQEEEDRGPPRRLSTFVGVEPTPMPVQARSFFAVSAPAAAPPVAASAPVRVTLATALGPDSGARGPPVADAAMTSARSNSTSSSSTTAASSIVGFSATYAGDIVRPPAAWAPDVALRVEDDGAAFAQWPGGRAALAVMVDDKATEALRRHALAAGLGAEEVAVLLKQSAYGVVAYPRETAPLAAAAQDDVVDGACVAVDGFGVGFVAAPDGSGAPLVHLAEDGSGFHADERGAVQRRWGPRGDVTFVAPTFVLSDLESLGALGAAAAERREAAGDGRAPDGDAAGGHDDAIRSPRGEAGVEADSESLRRSLLEHLFPGDASIPPLAARAPVSYLRSQAGVGFMLGSGLAVYVGLAGDRFVKLFLACRAFRYELVVAPGVPAALMEAGGAAKDLETGPT